jgi:hypothetical protein
MIAPVDKRRLKMWFVLIADEDGNCDLINEKPYSLADLSCFMDNCQWPVSAIVLLPALPGCIIPGTVSHDPVDRLGGLGGHGVNELLQSLKFLPCVNDPDEN